MGSSSSQPLSHPQRGYHILQVSPSSPGEEAGLIPYFDFIVEVNGQSVDKSEGIFEKELSEGVGKEIQLTVYNSRTEAKRAVVLKPSDTWGGAGVAGLSIRLHDIESAIAHVWHVLEVYQNSPASDAGLESFQDYIVGSPDVVFTSSEDFYNYVKSNLNSAIPLYIYSKKTNKVRLVSIKPSREWGGEGSLGCNIGSGYLHQIPLLESTVETSAPTTSSPTATVEIPPSAELTDTPEADTKTTEAPTDSA